jgi:MFS family permease
MGVTGLDANRRTGSVAGVRRLLLVLGPIVFVDTMLYSALSPLLPHLATRLGLSKTSAGVLVGAYAAGALLGGLPGGLAAARFGPRRTVLAGLAAMGVASLGFGIAQGFPGLFAARLLQGAGSAFTWAGSFAWIVAVAPRNRRGELLGAGIGAAVFGALFGPVVGVGAALWGRGAVFGGLAALAAVLALATRGLEAAVDAPSSRAAFGAALIDRQFGAGLVLMALPAALIGAISVLAPLRLAAAGFGAAAIGAVWLAAAGLEAAQAPFVGRVVDRRGCAAPVEVALAVGGLALLGLASGVRPLGYVPIVVLASMALGSLFTPAFALIAAGAEAAGLSRGVGFGCMNAAWAVGALAGAVLGGAVAGATSDWVPLTGGAGLCVGLLVGMRLAVSRRSSKIATGAAALGE